MVIDVEVLDDEFTIPKLKLYKVRNIGGSEKLLFSTVTCHGIPVGSPVSLKVTLYDPSKLDWMGDSALALKL
jgi:hypothetical protein